MNKITSTTELREAILLLEMKQATEAALLKEQFRVTYENLRPANLVKNTFHEIITASDFKGDLLNALLSLAAGYLSKKVVVGETVNPLKQLLGTLLQIGVTSLVSKNTDEIKSKAMELINFILHKKDSEA